MDIIRILIISILISRMILDSYKIAMILLFTKSYKYGWLGKRLGTEMYVSGI